MVRLIDVARAAGVSPMTVSRVLRDAPDISVKTKARIRTLVKEMGYVPDVLAQGLRTRLTKLFGVILPSLNDPIFARIAAGLEDSLREMGYDVLLAQSLAQPEGEERCIRHMLARRVEGLFLVPVNRLASAALIYQELEKRGAKVVILGPRAPFCERFTNVECDDAHASAAATQHLIGLGHRRIAFLAGSPASPAARHRMEGYRRAHRQAQIPVDDHLIFSAGGTIEDGAKAALQLLHESTQYTAIQAANDLIAIGAANTLLNQGVRIPQDLSVVGFGNILTSEFFRVPLTTVRQPKYRLAQIAVEAMLRLKRGQGPETRRMPAELVIRSSTAPPRNLEPSGAS